MRKIFYLVFISLVVAACNTEEPVKKIIDEQYEDGTPKKVSYEHEKGTDSTDAKFKEETYYKNGQIRHQGELKNGLKHGHWIFYYENGNVWSEGDFVEGVRNGPSVAYHKNGNKRMEGAYKDGKQVGEWKFYNDKGEYVKSEQFSK